jgi:hypothetical protein
MTLNELVAQIQKIGDDHKIIETTYNGVAIDLLSDREVTYPAFTFDISVGRISGPSLTWDVNMFFFDRVQQGGGNEREVQSDQVQIAQDVLASMRYPGNGFTVGDTFTVNLFTESTPELLAGCNMTLSIELPAASDRCVIPTDYNYVDA